MGFALDMVKCFVDMKKLNFLHFIISSLINTNLTFVAGDRDKFL